MEAFEKSIVPLIETVYPSFTTLEKTIADFFIHNTKEQDFSAKRIAGLLYVSEASLSRFAKKCGFAGYREFVYRYQEGLSGHRPDASGQIRGVLSTYQELLNKSYSLADEEQIARICRLLEEKDRIYVYGLGSSGLAATEMKQRFMLTGVNIEAIKETQTMKMNAVLLNSDCVAIGISISGQTREVLYALRAAHARGAVTVLFTSHGTSAHREYCDEVVLLAVKENLENGRAISPQFPILVMLDILYSSFLQSNSAKKDALYEYAATLLRGRRPEKEKKQK